MIFTSFWFLIFVFLFLIVFYACPSIKCRSLILAVASFLFYMHFAGPAGMVPIIVLGIITFVVARSKITFFINLGMWICVASLVFYKYIKFLADNLISVIPYFGTYPVSHYVPAAAPLAISFFVFEFVHYLYDVKKGESVIKSPLYFFHFAMFFPTLVAGPIKRYEQFLPELKQGLSSAAIGSSDFQIGFLRVSCGFAKKLVADSLTLYIATYDTGFTNAPLDVRWLIFSAIAMRIYLDFSGYSDMAIGFSRMMGIKIPENFNWPYLAISIKDFWRRWHISLSSWIRDYIYIPLGGSRVGPIRHGINFIFVFLLCGLWHGAAWNFALWGIYHGCGLVFQMAMSSLLRLVTAASRSASGKIVSSAPDFVLMSTLAKLAANISNSVFLVVCWGLTTLFVWSGWLLFFYSPDRAINMFVSLFHG